MVEFHPTAELFPLMEGAEFDRFADDIESNGLREPILVHPDGSIIDGRNRFRACEVPPYPPPPHDGQLAVKCSGWERDDAA